MLLPKEYPGDEDRYKNLMLDLEAFLDKHAALEAAISDGYPVYILDPDNYRTAGEDHSWSPDICSIILPPILKLLMLRLSMASEIDLGDGSEPQRIGADVPPCNIYTVELEMHKKEKIVHDQRTLHLLRRLFVGDTGVQEKRAGAAKMSATANSEKPEGMMDSGIYRYLMHCTLDPRLGKLTTLGHKRSSTEERRAAAKKRQNNWVDIDYDNGASYYFMATRDGPEYLVPADRLALATYMSAQSVKIRYALGLLGEWCLVQNEKVLLVFEFVMTQWYVQRLVDSSR